MARLEKKPLFEVRTRQLWECCDRRKRGARMRVVQVLDAKERCVLQRVDGGVDVGPTTTVRLSRMYEHSSGFKLVHPLPGILVKPAPRGLEVVHMDDVCDEPEGYFTDEQDSLEDELDQEGMGWCTGLDDSFD